MKTSSAMKTKAIAAPEGWEKLPYHSKSNTIEFGTGISVEKLAEFIKEYGYDSYEPVVLCEGAVFDGRHRHASSVIAGVTPTFRLYIGNDQDAYIAKKAFRQHLNESQRAMMAADLATAKAGQQPKPKGSKVPFGENPRSKKSVAEKLKVSAKSVQRAKKVKEHGTEELQQAVRDGIVKVTDAATACDESAKVQNDALCIVKDKKAKTLKAAIKQIKDAIAAKENTQEPSLDAGAQNEPSVDEDPWVDAWGIPITKDAEKAFLSQGKFDELIGILQKAKSLFKEIANTDGGQYLCLPGIGMNAKSGYQHAGIETAILNVKDAKPKYTVCPYAYNDEGTHPEKCNLCHNLGWIGSVNKDRIPESLIQSAKKAHGV